MLAQSKVPEDEAPLQILVSFDEDAGTITVADNGVGMSRQEVIDHIGTIAKSGYPGIPAGTERRPVQGRGPYRAVRGGLLLGLHRGRQGVADHAPGRPAR